MNVTKNHSEETHTSLHPQIKMKSQSLKRNALGRGGNKNVRLAVTAKHTTKEILSNAEIVLSSTNINIDYGTTAMDSTLNKKVLWNLKSEDFTRRKSGL